MAEAEQARAFGVGAARSVVGHLDGHRPPVGRDHHCCGGRSRMFRSIRERLGDDVVSGGFDRRGKPVIGDVHLHEKGGALGE